MKNLLILSITALILSSIIAFGMGVNKLTKYENPDSGDYEDDEYSYYDDEDEEDESVNVYVGGDAYNYIINSERATGLFVLAGFSLLTAVGLGIILQLRREEDAEIEGKYHENREVKQID